MESLSANEAKTHFGNLLLKVQREPIQINRNGKAVAVVLSVENYENYESLKMQYLKNRVEEAKKDIGVKAMVDGDAFFEELINGKFDKE